MSVCVCLWLNMKEFGNHLHQCIKRYFKNHHQILDCDAISQKGAVNHKWQHDLVQFILFKDEQITYMIGSAVSIICMASMFSLHSYQTQIYKNFIHTCTSKHTVSVYYVNGLQAQLGYLYSTLYLYRTHMPPI